MPRVKRFYCLFPRFSQIKLYFPLASRRQKVIELTSFNLPSMRFYAGPFVSNEILHRAWLDLVCPLLLHDAWFVHYWFSATSRLSRIEFPIDINQTSPFSIVGLLGSIFFIFIHVLKTLLFPNSGEPDQFCGV